MTPKETALLRRMVAGHRAAAARSLESRGVSAETSFADALQLWELNPGLFDEPRDAVRLRDDKATRETWAILRRRWR